MAVDEDAQIKSDDASLKESVRLETVENMGGVGAAEEEEDPVVSFKTWVVVWILSCGYGLSFWPIPVMANIGGLVAAELGEPEKAYWFIPAWTISITVCFMLCGANTDLLGRRWFLVLGNLVCTIGHIITASKPNASAVIAGMAISGFGGGNCQMAAFALSELLPNKWRHIGVVIADITTIIAVIIGPVTARFGIESHTWQWNFWAAAIAQFLSFLGLLFLYFPPAHPYGIPFRQMVKEIDYVGGLLFIAGAVPVLMGIVWTTVYPSNSPYVIGPLVAGFGCLVLFALWERFAKIKHPLTPTYVFTSSYGRDLTAPAIALGVVNMFYYSSSILWPTMIQALYTNGGTNWRYGIILSLPQGFAILAGALGLAQFGSRIRHWQWQLTGSVFVMVFFGSLLALVNTHNKGLMLAFVFLSQAGYGWAIYLAIAVSQMGVEHKDLGISGGISGVARFAAGSMGTSDNDRVGAAVYTTILTNTTNDWITKLVPSAALDAGLAQSRVADLMEAVGTPALAEDFSPRVVSAVAQALAEANVHGIRSSLTIFQRSGQFPNLVYRVVALASMAFGIVGIIAAALCKDVDSKMNNKARALPCAIILITNDYSRLRSTSRTPDRHLEISTTRLLIER
ncbi:hypothetical protein A1O7_09023 [Cladophialophora yegresii CBS 114405]|uniref:Major facilitator superfamily (MFS) profile domain-containing protein n=1 Tax=Cladophialophora yegresii CBS 114405 TaxID=1182544 RepID=W9VK75_9EURO|nr:uncharacterized protein A1O7_09023 [Cladophialophora yegresii CBS 114405]EXJ56092.1 hypothetical protein A1O7_09023 [Cladophialophora yegresii CBS 114405]